MASGNLTLSNLTASNQTVSIFAGRQTELTAWFIVTGGTTYFGVIMNILALVATWPREGQSPGFSVLICHFIILHLFMCLVNIPTAVFTVLAKSKPYWVPNNFCVHAYSLWTLNITLINWSDVGLALNRCVALLFPYHYAAWNTRRCSLTIIAMAWAICGCTRVAFYLTLDLRTVHVMTQTGYCAYRKAPGDVMSSITVYTEVVLPYMLTGLGALLILLRSIHLTCRTSTVGVSGQSQARRRRLTKMLLLTFLWTATCNTPGYVIVGVFREVARKLAMSELWLRVPMPFQYGFTPCILLLSNDKYREQVVRKLTFSRLGAGATGSSGTTSRKKKLPLQDNVGS